MKILRGVWFCFGVLVFGSIWVLLNNGSMGSVIWEPSVVGSCVDSEILTLWDEVFVENKSSVIILKNFIEPEGDCKEYIAYKNNSDGFWVLYGEFYNSSWNSSSELYSSGKRILNSVKLYSFYSDVGSDFLGNFLVQENVSWMMKMILSIDGNDVDNWSIESEDEARDKFNEFYDFVDSDWIPFSGNNLTFYFNENDDFGWNSSFASIVLWKNKSIFNSEYWKYIYDPNFSVSFSSDVGNFSFFANSSWNFGFDYKDYFNFSDGFSVEIERVGGNISEGYYINYSFNGSRVSFMPVPGFIGQENFRMIVRGGFDDVYSNIFSVNIVSFNKMPILMKKIPDVYIKNDYEFLDLGDYFNGGENLSYGVVGVSGINYSFNGSVLKIGISDDFNGSGKFKVYAFNGVNSVFSDFISVFWDGFKKEEKSVNLISKDDLNLGVIINNESVSTNFDERNNNARVDLREGGIDWISLGLVTFIVLIFVWGVGFVVYFFIMRKNGRVISKNIRHPVAYNYGFRG